MHCIIRTIWTKYTEHQKKRTILSYRPVSEIVKLVNSSCIFMKFKMSRTNKWSFIRTNLTMKQQQEFVCKMHKNKKSQIRFQENGLVVKCIVQSLQNTCNSCPCLKVRSNKD